MKKVLIVLFIFISLFFVCCGPNAQELINAEKAKYPALHTLPSIYNMSDSQYSIIIIDSCEYIVGWSGLADGGPFITHKGNCKFCKKRK